MIDYKRSPSSFMSFGLFFATLVVMVSLLAFGSIISAEAKSSNGDDLGATPNLPFGDINVVVLTDIHSWLGSHRRQEPRYDADLGDVLSFWERLKEFCDGSSDSAVSVASISTPNDEDDDGPCRNLFLVNNGDFVDGTGLSRAIDGENNPAYLIPLLEKMPYDAVNVGNHELYSKENIEYMTRPGGYVDWWGDRYLTSNIHKVGGISGLHFEDLTKDNMKEWMDNNEMAFINFFAPWCVWCQRLEPTWEKFAVEIKSLNMPVGIAKVDCFSQVALCRDEKIMGFPTLRWYEGGKPITPDYKMDRTVHAMTNFAKRKLEMNVKFKEWEKGAIARGEFGAGISKTETNVPLGSRYKILHGHDSKVLAFGFLYNMWNAAKDAGIEIEKVQTTVKQQWFSNALTEEQYDAILVLAHMDLVDPLVDVLRKAIRDIVGENTPIVFLTGHTHYRGSKQLDDLAVTFEAGRYLDTVGFISFPKKDSVRSQNTSSLFKHNFLDTNRKLLFEDTLGFSSVEEGETANGKEFSQFIDTTRTKLGLERVVGCAPQSYYANHHVDAPDSLWGFFRDEVIPKMFSTRQILTSIQKEDDDLPTAMLLPSESFRYDLYNNSNLVVDDIYAVAPFNDTVVHMGTFSSDVILEANKTLNKHIWKLPNFILIGAFDDESDDPLVATTKKYHLYSYEFQAGDVKNALAKIVPSEKVEIKKTEWTSSLIWLAFVEQYWPCDGAFGKLPGWFPKYQYVFPIPSNENGEMDDTKSPMSATLFLTFLTTIPLIATVVTSVALFWIVVRRYLAYQPVAVVRDDDAVLGEEDGFYILDGFEKS